MGWGGLGPTRPCPDVTDGSGTNQASGSLSSLSRQAKAMELEFDSLGYI